MLLFVCCCGDTEEIEAEEGLQCEGKTSLREKKLQLYFLSRIVVTKHVIKDQIRASCRFFNFQFSKANKTMPNGDSNTAA